MRRRPSGTLGLADGHAGPMTSTASPPAAVVVRPSAPSPGRAIPAAPPRREGPAKLTGKAKYADDLVFPGAWYGTTVRSTEPHARLLAVELGDAFDWKRVVVVTANDIPGENIVSLIDDDQPALVPVGGEIRHQAEPLVLLAAPDPATLREARRHVTVRTQPLPAVFDPLQATQEFAHFSVGRGDVDAGFAEADIVIEGEYRVGHQEQLYIENQAMIGVPREDGGVSVHGSLQCPYYIHKALKRALGLSDTQAVVVQSETGGGFGGKEEYPSMIALHAALLARKCGKPVRMIYDRHEDISATTKRHPAIMRHRTGVTRDGRLVAQDIEVIMDGGAYCTLTPVVLTRGVLHAAGPYRCDNVRIRGRAMATNTPPNGAFRGFGAPQTEFAAEMQVNRIAEALDVSPLDLRRRWVYREGDTTPTGQVLRESVAGIEVLEAAGGRRRSRRSAAKPRAAERRARRIRHRSGAGLAWRGIHRLGRGPAGFRGVAGAHRRGPHPHPHRLDRDGPGHQDDLPAAGLRGARHRVRRGRDCATGHLLRPRLGPDGCLADGHGRRRSADPRRGAPAPAGRGAHGPAVRRVLPPRPGPMRVVTSSSSPTPASPSTTRRTPATPTRPTAGPAPWYASTSTSTPGRWRCVTASRPTRSDG